MTATNNKQPIPRSTIAGNRVWASGLKPPQLMAVLALQRFYERVKDHSFIFDHADEITLSPKYYDWFFCLLLDRINFMRKENVFPRLIIKERMEGDAEDSLRLMYFKSITDQNFELYIKQAR